MKNLSGFLIITGLFLLASCQKGSDESENFKLLTGPVWKSDSLLVNGVDAGGPTGFLKNFNGDVKFNTDGTGYFGNYPGTWKFTMNETQLVLTTDSLPIPLTTKIVELKQSSLKVTTNFPQINQAPLYIRMTFKPK
jgi:hypothetical protein